MRNILIGIAIAAIGAVAFMFEQDYDDRRRAESIKPFVSELRQARTEINALQASFDSLNRRIGSIRSCNCKKACPKCPRRAGEYEKLMHEVNKIKDSIGMAVPENAEQEPGGSADKAQVPAS